MNLINFIFALIKGYVNIPEQYQNEIIRTEADAEKWYVSVKEDSDHSKPEKMIKKFSENWICRTILLLIYLPVARWLMSLTFIKSEEQNDETI